MKKWIILTAMTILFIYPIISITQMAFVGSLDLLQLKKSAIYSMVCIIWYFYLLWAFSTTFGLITTIAIFIVGLILALALAIGIALLEGSQRVVCTSVDLSDWRTYFEIILFSFSFAVGVGQGCEIHRKKYEQQVIAQVEADKKRYEEVWKIAREWWAENREKYN